MAEVKFGLRDPGHYEVAARLTFRQQFAGWQPTNLALPVEGRRQVPLESHFIEEAYLLYNFKPLEVTIGRAPLHYGPLRNSLMISDRIPFLDMIRLRLPMGEWSYDYAVSSPETRRGLETEYTRSTFFVTHRVEWGKPDLRFGLVEQALLDRNTYDAAGNVLVKGSYTLTDFLPVFSYHQGDVKPFNTMVGLDVAWQAAPGWKISGQLGLDDVDAKTFGIPDDPLPTIWAFILGTELDRGSWNFYAEVGSTHVLWGNYYADRAGAKAIYRILFDNLVAEAPLTSPYGPGTGWIQEQLKIERGAFRIVEKGELWASFPGITLDSPYEETTAPDWSTLTISGRFSVAVTYITRSIEYTIKPGFLLYNEQVTPQLTLSLNIHSN